MELTGSSGVHCSDAGRKVRSRRGSIESLEQRLQTAIGGASHMETQTRLLVYAQLLIGESQRVLLAFQYCWSQSRQLSCK